VNSQVAVAILVVVGCILLLSFISRQASVDIASPLRLWLWRRDARRMQARSEYPESVSRAYWTAREYERDAAELRALGYAVESEETADPYVTLPAVPSFGRPNPTPRRRRVPTLYVIYVHRLPRESATPSQR